MLVGQQFETRVTPQPPAVETVAYQPRKMWVGGSISHYDEDHGDHIVHRTIRRDVNYTPETQYYTREVPQPDIVTQVPVTNFYSVPVQHEVNTSHVDYKHVQHTENVVTEVPKEVERHGVEYIDEEYTEMVPVKKIRKVAKPTIHKETVIEKVVTPVTHTDVVPVVHNEKTFVTDNHIVAQSI